MNTSPDYAENYEEQTGTDPTAVAPVDVRVVTPVRVENYEARSIITDQVPVGTTPQRIAGAHRTRVSLVVAPHGGDIYVGGSGMVTTGVGFLVADGAVLQMGATDEVWAVSTTDAVETIVVHTLAEVREG